MLYNKQTTESRMKDASSNSIQYIQLYCALGKAEFLHLFQKKWTTIAEVKLNANVMREHVL